VGGGKGFSPFTLRAVGGKRYKMGVGKEDGKELKNPFKRVGMGRKTSLKSE
jgi:hypothetical protein